MEPAKIAKLARVALDYRTPEPEAQAALRFIRAQEADWVTVTTAIALTAGISASQTRPPDSFQDPVMPFGKYKGRKLSRIASSDPDYLCWVLEACTRIQPRLREQIRLAVDAFA